MVGVFLYSLGRASKPYLILFYFWIFSTNTGSQLIPELLKEIRKRERTEDCGGG